MMDVMIMHNEYPYLTKANFKKFITGEKDMYDTHVSDIVHVQDLLSSLNMGDVELHRGDDKVLTYELHTDDGMTVHVHRDITDSTIGIGIKNTDAPIMFNEKEYHMYLTPRMIDESGDVGHVTYEGGDECSDVTHEDTENLGKFCDKLMNAADKIESDWDDDANYIVSGKILNNSYIYDPNCNIVEIDDYDLKSALKSMEDAGITFME